MSLSEREVLKSSLDILRKIFKTYVKVERRQVAMFTNPSGQRLRFGKKGESDIGGWIIQGPYIAKPLVIEVKRESFRPSRIYGDDLIRFKNQCEFIRRVNQDGGVGFWINKPGHLYPILLPVLRDGAKVTLDVNNCVIVKAVSKVINIDDVVHDI